MFNEPNTLPLPSSKAKITVRGGGIIISTPDGKQVCLSPSVVRIMARHLPKAADVAEISSMGDNGPQAWKTVLPQ